MSARLSSNIKCSRAKEHLAQRIISGEFAFGSRFPSLNELCEEYHLSYVTICKAVKFLETEGYLRCQPGIGYFVCYAAPGMASARKEVNIISTHGYYKSYRYAFEKGIEVFEKNAWHVNLLLTNKDIYDLKPAINSPDAFTIITAFNVNWERFSATFGHVAKRVIVLGRLSGNPEITGIVADEFASVRVCMEHFARLGRKKVALAVLLPHSELESLRIAAWRNMVAAEGLSFEWMRRHLFSLDMDRNELSEKDKVRLFKSYLEENIHDMDAVILPSALPSFVTAAIELGIKIPDDLEIVSIGCKQDEMQRKMFVNCLDNNFAGHFQLALEVLEDRLANGNTVPGAWYFCPPGNIISSENQRRMIGIDRK